MLQAMLRASPANRYGGSWFHKLKAVASSPGECHFEMLVEKEHLNRGGTMHGGCTATLLDITTIMTVGRSALGELPAVSVDLSISYLKAVKLGDEITIDTKTVKEGKTMVVVEAIMSKKDDGSLLAIGKQIMAKTLPSNPK